MRKLGDHAILNPQEPVLDRSDPERTAMIPQQTLSREWRPLAQNLILLHPVRAALP